MSDYRGEGLRLRTDLGSVVVAGSTRGHRIVVDEISGRFSRISERAWSLLQSDRADRAAWEQAAAAGWLRTRIKTVKSRFSPLMFRISLGSIDRVAAWLAPRTDWLFAPTAILFWCLVGCVALVISISARAQWVDAVKMLPSFLQHLHPLGLAAVFVATKVIHELAHAVACRRVGARCGDVGVLVMCGMPCPYCDVTDVWRIPRAASRCGVMLAGIYVELAIASIALFGWMVSRDPAWQLFFVYVMLICGVSTLVFNANPLMRYDGYHVLSDLVGSTNLRTESRDAWARLFARMIGGAGNGRTFRHGRRVYAFAGYHVASTVYRCLIGIAIASFLIHLASYVHLRPVVVVVVTVAFFSFGIRSTSKLLGVASGRGVWEGFPQWRRLAFVVVLVAMVCGMLFVPLPRYRQVVGRVEPADAVTIYVKNGGIIETVDAEVGSLVTVGQRLAMIRNPDVTLQTMRLTGQLRLASLRLRASERSALDRPEVARQWEILGATKSATSESVRSAQEREQQNEIVATVSGMVLPPNTSDSIAVSQYPPLTKAATSTDLAIARLTQFTGLGAERDGAWCRISPTRSRRVVLALSADDFQNVNVGHSVMIRDTVCDHDVSGAQITSISPVARDTTSVTEEAWFQATCPLPDVDDSSFLRSIGARCDVVIRLPSRALAEDALDWVMVWLRG